VSHRKSLVSFAFPVSESCVQAIIGHEEMNIKTEIRPNFLGIFQRILLDELVFG
jgi:hypothetical protein